MRVGPRGTVTSYAAFHPVPLLRIGLSLLVTAWALARVRGRNQAWPTVQAWAIRLLATLRIRVTLAGPIPVGGQLWVSNHLSWVDPMIYLSMRPCLVMAKAEVADYPAFGAGASRIVRFVRRESLFSRAAALRTLIRDLQAGEAFLIFPEGTTTGGDQLAPLYEGGLRMAFRLGITVLPLRLATEDSQYPWVGEDPLLPHMQALAYNRATRVVIHPGPVLDPRQHADEQAWMRAIRAHLEPLGGVP